MKDAPSSGSPRQRLFDLAVNRARRYAVSLGLPLDDSRALKQGLEPWYLRTRFAYRAPLDEIVAALQGCPGGDCHFSGGPHGDWRQGRPPQP